MLFRSDYEHSCCPYDNPNDKPYYRDIDSPTAVRCCQICTYKFLSKYIPILMNRINDGTVTNVAEAIGLLNGPRYLSPDASEKVRRQVWMGDILDQISM